MEKFKSKMIRIYVAPFWKYKCDAFYFRKWKYIKGVSFRIFYVNVQITERNALEKMIAIGRKIMAEKAKNAGMV